MKKIYIIGLSLCLVGISTFFILMMILGWDFSKLSTMDPYTEHQLVVENHNQAIVIQNSNMPVRIGKSPDDQIHCTYMEREHEGYEIDQTNGLTIKRTVSFDWSMFGVSIDFSNPSLTLLLPDDFAGNLEVSNSNASLIVADVSATNMTLSTTNSKLVIENVTTADKFVATNQNGRLQADGLHADEIACSTSNSSMMLNNLQGSALVAKNQNGSLRATAITCENAITLSTGNARLTVGTLQAKQEINLTNHNGSISGTLPGDQAHYRITSSATNGSNTLPTQSNTGTIALHVTTTNSKIDLTFIP